MKVTVKKVGDEFRLYVATPVMGDQPAGLRLRRADYPQQPFPKQMRHNDAGEAMKAAEQLQAYLDKDSKQRRRKR